MYASTSELLFMSIILLIMLVLTYYATKFIAKSYGTSGGRKTKLFEIIDRIHLSKDSALLVVKVGEKVVLLGVTSQSVNKICDLDESFIQSNTLTETSDQITFAEALMHNMKNKFRKEENKDFDD